MKVLQLISSSYGYYGAERVCVTLAAELEKIGVDSVVGAFRNAHKASHVEVLDHANEFGLETEEITCQGRFDWNAVLAFRELVQRHKIDIIHCHNIKPNLYSWLAARKVDVALLSTCHSLNTGTAGGWLISVLDRCILRSFDRVVLVSDHMKPQVHRFALPADIIYNGIDLAPVSRPKSDLRERMNWSERPVIGAIGRLSPEKGIKYFLRAAARVLQDIPNALFLIVGDGPDRKSLEADAKALGICGSVCFLGVREDIPELLSCLDVLVMPSLIEGMPMALLEAMASALPVVASRVGSIPAVVQNRVNGIMVSPGNANALAAELLDLLVDDEIRFRVGQRARETVELNFSAASMARRYLQVYRSMTRN
jgi:glycosyltransferase involved in cell wall biosynthesis